MRKIRQTTINDLSSIYKDVIIEEDDGWSCNVCGKKVKRKSTIEKHVSKMDCFKMYHVFKNTIGETCLMKMHHICSSHDKTKSVSRMSVFRRTRMYSTLAKFYLFCLEHNIKNPIEYLRFIVFHLFPDDYTMSYKKLSLGQKKQYLSEFKKTRKPSLHECRMFYEMNKSHFDDSNFVIRSMEVGEILPEYVFSHVISDFDDFVNSLSDIQKDRLLSIIESYE